MVQRRLPILAAGLALQPGGLLLRLYRQGSGNKAKR